MPWLNYHVYTTDVEALLLTVVREKLNEHASHLEQFFFERHYAGGPHLRLRVRPRPSHHDAVNRSLTSALTAFVESHPSDPDPSYSPDRARHNLQQEGEDPDRYDLTQRTNVVETPPYEGFQAKVANSESARLLEDFYQDIAPLIFDVLEHDDRPLLHLLRLGFLLSCVASSEHTRGVIGFKSHWSTYAMELPDPIVSAIKERCDAERDGLIAMMKYVEDWYASDARADDAILTRWNDVMHAYMQRAIDLRAEGVHVFEPITPERFEARRQKLLANDDTPEFMKELYRTPDYMMSQNNDAGFTAGRLLINLLYLVIPLLGLRPVDKCMMCYACFSTKEVAYDYDVTETLRAFKKHRQTEAASPTPSPTASSTASSPASSSASSATA